MRTPGILLLMTTLGGGCGNGSTIGRDADVGDVWTVEDASQADGFDAFEDPIPADVLADVLTSDVETEADAAQPSDTSVDVPGSDDVFDARIDTGGLDAEVSVDTGTDVQDAGDPMDAGLSRCRPIHPIANPAGEWFDSSATTLAGTRAYRVFVPATVPAIGERPMLIALHGCDQSAAEFAAGSRMMEHAAARGAVLVLPEQPLLANPLGCWNWFLAVNQAAGTGESGILRAIISDAMADHGADPSRVYVTGLSAGGGMASILAACHQDVVQAAAIVSGPSYMASTSATGSVTALEFGPLTTSEVAGAGAGACTLRGDSARMLVVHGSADEVVNPIYAETVIDVSVVQHDWEDDSSRNGSIELDWTSEVVLDSGELSARYRRMDDSLGLRFAQLWVEGLGHAWSGGDVAFPYTTDAGPDTSADIWDFFERPECFGLAR